MNIIRITVDTDLHSQLLMKMLKSIRFVTKVEPVEISANKKSGVSQFNNLKNILDSIGNHKIFEEIKDPVEWQKQLRNEWE